MDVKEAVITARGYVADMFADDDVSNLGLEEVERDEPSGVWRVTVGFSRPWDRPSGLGTLTMFPRTQRAFKVVSVNDNGKVLSVKNRETIQD